MSLPLLLDSRRLRQIDAFLTRRAVRVSLFAGVFVLTWLLSGGVAYA